MIPIYLLNHLNIAKENKRWHDSKLAPRKSWTSVSRRLSLVAAWPKHCCNKELSSSSSSLFHWGWRLQGQSQGQGIARAVWSQSLSSPFLQLPVRSMWDSGCSLSLPVGGFTPNTFPVLLEERSQKAWWITTAYLHALQMHHFASSSAQENW